MSDPTDDFFAGLDGSDEHGSFTGHRHHALRPQGRRQAAPLVRRSDKGRVTVSRDAGEADCVLGADIGTFEAIVAGRRTPWPHSCAARSQPGANVLLIDFQRLFPGPPTDGSARSPAMRGGCHERRPRQDPRRQHLRGQRHSRRHRGLADRSHRPVLLRHALPLPLGAHRRRGAAAQPAVGRRPAVLRDALLPGAGHRHRVHRRQAFGDPQTGRRQGFHEELTILNHDEKPSTARCGWRRTPTSPTCSRSRTSWRRRASTSGASTTAAWCSATTASNSCARPGSRRPSRRRRRARPDLRRSTWNPTASGRPDLHVMLGVDGARAAPSSPSTSAAETRSRAWSAAWRSGSTTRRTRTATGTR